MVVILSPAKSRNHEWNIGIGGAPQNIPVAVQLGGIRMIKVTNQ
jgi:hypothetical protein